MSHLQRVWARLAAAEEEDHGPLYHGTSSREHAQILQQGFKLPEQHLRGADYGHAVYLTNDKDFAQSYGSRVVTSRLAPGTRIANLQRPESADLMADAARHAGLPPTGKYNEHGWWGDVHSSVDGSAIEKAAKEHGYHGVTDGYVYALYHPERLQVQGAYGQPRRVP